MAAVFDGISNVPADVDVKDSSVQAHNPPKDGSIPKPDKWRQTKRLLLATVDDDSTIVYYIVNDGIVKPRQN